MRPSIPCSTSQTIDPVTVLDKRKIVLKEAIKNVGTYTATCKLGYEITAPLTVKVVEA